MLQLRPNCEYCDKDLPATATDAMICSYECTFCAACVTEHLENVCPNCGGGFCPRPIRPSTAWRAGVSLVHQPASSERVALKHPRDGLAGHIAQIRGIPAEER